jgi:hypothetical protein
MLHTYACGMKLYFSVQGTTHVEVLYGEAGHLFISRSSVLCDAGLTNVRYMDDGIGEKFGLHTELGCQALS